MENDLKIFVIGKTQTGKTTICRIIQNALKENGIPTIYHDEDIDLIENELDKNMLEKIQKCNGILIDEINI